MPLLGKTKRFILCSALFAGSIALPFQNLHAETKSKWEPNFSLPRYYAPSTNLNGIVGLNTVPSARMDKKGTVRFGSGKDDPYYHAFIGFQLADPFYVSFRQTSQTDSIKDSPDSFHPGVDFKLRLLDETASRPAIAVGLDSAFGDKRMASEYLTFSKRYKNFDFTGGMAWGRLGSKGHIKNPLRAISDHFGNERDYNSFLESQDTNDWFTGEEIGFFGGVEYFSPIEGLSIKADYGANDYIGEQGIDYFDAPDPWSLSLNYKPLDNIDISAGTIGGETFMARLSMQDQLQAWVGKPYQDKERPPLHAPRKNNNAKSNNVLALSSFEPLGYQIGREAIHVANHSKADQEAIILPLKHKGLKGPVITLMRSDLEKAVLSNTASPDEIWHNAEIDKASSMSWMDLNENVNLKQRDHKGQFKLVLEQKVGLSESDAGFLYKTSGLIEAEKALPYGFLVGATGRVNIADNLRKLSLFRFRDPNPVRSDERDFAANRFGVDRLYGSFFKSLTPSTHMNISAGYLEKMFSGYGGEILYRPFGKTYAIGAEGWRVHKRDPDSRLAKDMDKNATHTGHLNLYYEMPNKTTTAYLKLGQYLREDRGATFGIQNNFDNGTKLEGFITSTNRRDADILGNRTHVFGGVRLSLPLGSFPFIPNGSEFRLYTEPFARDSGQILDIPQSLYEVTEPISSRHLHQSWKNFLE